MLWNALLFSNDCEVLKDISKEKKSILEEFKAREKILGLVENKFYASLAYLKLRDSMKR